MCRRNSEKVVGVQGRCLELDYKFRHHPYVFGLFEITGDGQQEYTNRLRTEPSVKGVLDVCGGHLIARRTENVITQLYRIRYASIRVDVHRPAFCQTSLYYLIAWCLSCPIGPLSYLWVKQIVVEVKTDESVI